MTLYNIRDVLPRGRNGQGVIDSAIVVDDRRQAVPTYDIRITIDGKKYSARLCIVQTENWTPKKGDLVQFVRQPETISDVYLFVSLLSE